MPTFAVCVLSLLCGQIELPDSRFDFSAASTAEVFEPDPAVEPEAELPRSLADFFDHRCCPNPLAPCGVKFSGNLDQSVAWNFQSPSDNWNGPVTWTDRANEYQLNQLWFNIERPADTTDHDWAWGGKISSNYGTNSRLMTASGFEGDLNGGNAFYGWAFPNAYAEVAYRKLNVKAGRFVSPIGYFTVDTTQNFFNTIPLTFQWGEPFTHTGIWASYPVTAKLQMSSALVRGWDNFDDSNPSLGYMGTSTYTWDDKSNLSHLFIYSREPNANLNFSPRYFQSLVYTKPWNDQLTYVAQCDFGVQKNALANGKAAYWYGFNQYWFYKINERITFGLNFEWWRDEEGYRLAGFLPGDAPSGITSHARGFPPDRFGYAGNFYQFTLGPKWYPTASKNCFIRPNLRIDWFDGDVLNPGGLKPYDDGTKNYQTLFITDLAILF